MTRFLGICALLLASSAYAQEFQAVINGIVTDSTGAAVPGAKIRVTSIERNVESETTSNDSGFYITRHLAPGAYTVAVEKEGFKKFERDGIQLAGSDRLNLDVRLDIGSLSESVTVSGEVQRLETETASRTGADPAQVH